MKSRVITSKIPTELFDSVRNYKYTSEHMCDNLCECENENNS